MPDLTTQNSTTIDQNWAAAVQGACNTLLDFTVGSILRALGQGMKGVVLWLQGLILKLLLATRLATSFGDDVDSFVADFGLTRIAAVASTGVVTLSRFTPTNAALVLVGATIQTADGSQTFTVVADPSQPTWSPSQNGYLIPAATASATATVQAVNGGSGGNISAGTLTVLQTGISGVDTVTNASAFTNGLDAESSSSLKARFVSFFNSLSKATVGAFAFVIASLQQGLQSQIIENKDFNGATDNGMVTVIIDDGSGSTPSQTVSNTFNAVDMVRAAGIRIGVFAAAKVTANVTYNIHVAAGYVAADVLTLANAAIVSAINSTGLGNTFDYMKIGQAAYDASPGVANVTAVVLNGAAIDLPATQLQTIKAGTVIGTLV